MVRRYQATPAQLGDLPFACLLDIKMARKDGLGKIPTGNETYIKLPFIDDIM